MSAAAKSGTPTKARNFMNFLRCPEEWATRDYTTREFHFYVLFLTLLWLLHLMFVRFSTFNIVFVTNLLASAYHPSRSWRIRHKLRKGAQPIFGNALPGSGDWQPYER
jgi:hypothetical protein